MKSPTSRDMTTPASRFFPMIFRNYNLNPVSDFRPR